MTRLFFLGLNEEVVRIHKSHGAVSTFLSKRGAKVGPGAEIIERHRQAGPQQFSNWDASLFEKWVEGPISTLLAHLQQGDELNPSQVQIFQSYLSLVQAALWQSATKGMPRFIEHCLWHLIPQQLSQLPPAQQAPLLAKVWNLAEGLAHEPLWVEQYVLSRIGELHDLTVLDTFLIELLTPILTTPSPAQFKPPFQHTILNARPLEQDFLPGPMHLAAPSVVCIKDRFRPIYLALLLERKNRSRLLGPLTELGKYQQDVNRLPIADFFEQFVNLNNYKIPLPLLAHVESSLLSIGGFLIASSVDSQRLWVVECD